VDVYWLQITCICSYHLRWPISRWYPPTSRSSTAPSTHRKCLQILGKVGEVKLVEIFFTWQMNKTVTCIVHKGLKCCHCVRCVLRAPNARTGWPTCHCDRAPPGPYCDLTALPRRFSWILWEEKDCRREKERNKR